MLKIDSCAIIAEYNPFHNGHLYQIAATKAILGDVPIVCILSGSFTQRGEPAFLDKWTRAKWALGRGCNLVLELPFVYSVQSANRFAAGATSIIKGLNCVTRLSFGCETTDMNLLQKIADYKETEEYSFRLNMSLKSGNSFARANEIALSKLNIKDDDILKSPNAILAMEYVSCLKNTNINPIVIQRLGDYNDDKTLNATASASAIRKCVINKSDDYQNCVPIEVYEDLKAFNPVTLQDYFPIIQSKIFELKEEGLKTIHEVNEGLENRIYESALTAKNMEELILGVKSKRYLYSRLQRIMLYILLDIKKDFINTLDKNNFPAYARVLALDNEGAKILAKSSIPVISKAADYKKLLNPIEEQIFEKDLLATNMYSIFSSVRPNEDFLHLIIKK
ncbi:MAG: nucleotidyltransferase family protein [Clostridia bacterium]|nr:nucleotidyltransferase family protein [Clostridia bacterium]